MLELRSRPCAVHHSYLITNFCQEKECLLPLCPKCVQLHSKEHVQANRPPQIDSIDLALQEVRKHNSVMHSMLHAAGQELASFQTKQKWAEGVVRRQMADIKRLLVNQLVRTIDVMETRILSQLETINSELTFQLTELDEEVRQLIGASFKLDHQLKGPNCLKHLIEFHRSPDTLQHQFQSFKEKLWQLHQPSANLVVEPEALERIRAEIMGYCRLELKHGP